MHQLIGGQIGLTKKKELTGCGIEVEHRKVTDAKGKMNNLFGCLRRDNFDSNASILHRGDQSLSTVSKHLKKMFDRKVEALQRGVHDVFCSKVGDVQKSIVDAAKVVD